MDQQNQKPDTPAHVPTEAEIARLEAQAVAALQRGETSPVQGNAPEVQAPPAQAGFVPYVDDVPEQKPAKPQPAQQAQPEAVDADDDDEPYIPSEMEKRIDAMTEKQWKRWQMMGGGVIGAVVVAALFLLGQELSTYSLILAAVLAIFLPRYLERAWRRKLTTARFAMVVVMAAGLVVAFLIMGFRTGFVFTRS